MLPISEDPPREHGRLRISSCFPLVTLVSGIYLWRPGVCQYTPAPFRSHPFLENLLQKSAPCEHVLQVPVQVLRDRMRNIRGNAPRNTQGMAAWYILTPPWGDQTGNSGLIH